MIKIKKGFSLAELLIAMAIIAIISFMGISISKKGVEKAYNYYYYKAYSSLSLAIADAISSSSEEFDLLSLTRHVVYVLGASIYDFSKVNYGVTTIRTNDNVEILIYVIDESLKKYLFILGIPAEYFKGEDGTLYKKYYTYYLLDLDNLHYGLIPSNNEPSADSKSLLKRADLLPFSIDDEVTAKIVQRFNSEDNIFESPKYSDSDRPKREIYSYYDAFCALYPEGYNSELSINGPDFKITCPTPNGPPPVGVLKVMDPKKVF